MGWIAGLDIGGTKLAVTVARFEDGTLTVTGKRKLPTPSGGWQPTLDLLESALGELLEGRRPEAIGISCGGPLDSAQGLILSPPNLPGWDRVPVCSHFTRAFGSPCFLQNDADACALAEWRFGAGQGCRHMVFLTFGTGLGAGLILNGQLYSGAANLAGELGHCRSPQDGSPYAPVGYGKAGSFEGFCSGGGIAELGRSLALERLQRGEAPAFCPTRGDLEGVTALSIAQAAQAGDPTALEVYRCSGRHLGMALALLCDLLNPQRIVIGSIYARSQELLRDAALEVLSREALPGSRAACQVVPAVLGEQLGDTAALSVALNGLGLEASQIAFAL
ncbi:MAG: ROK family protein [Acutalibacter sp.]|jgi:glucokinase